METAQGGLKAFDARPPQIEPTGGPAGDFGRRKYDDADYHQGPAEAAGQPVAHAFTHMGLYLAWAIRRDLHEPRMFSAKHIADVKAGRLTGSDLADDVDEKLISDWFIEEGAAFGDARHAAYLEAYDDAFSDLPHFGVQDDEASAARIEPVLDRLYREWVEAGRPEYTMPDEL